MAENVKLLKERQAEHYVVKTFINDEDRKQADTKMITNVKTAFANIKKKKMG